MTQSDPPGASTFEPVYIFETELSQPLPDLTARHPHTGRPYRRAVTIARLYTRPVGMCFLDLDSAGHLPPETLAQTLWAELGADLNAHLTAQGYAPLHELPLTGILLTSPPADVAARETFLANHPPAVSVVIPTRERTDTLRACLDSLATVAYPPFEIIVVDNAPTTDATATLVAQYPHVRYVREDRPGVSYARNRGMHEATGEIIVRIDDDAVVDRYWLVELIRGFSAAENVACVNGLVFPLELETPAQLWFEQYGGFNRGFDQKIFDLDQHRPPSPFFPYTVGQVGTGASMAVRKSALLEVGGSDPALGPGSLVRNGEDIDVYFKLLKRGYQIVYQPTALAYHLHRREYSRLQKQIHNYGVGFSAFVTKCLLTHPADIPGFLWRLPKGLWLMLSPTSVHNAKKDQSYPAELRWLERQGLLKGTWFYFQSRAAVRRGEKIGGDFYTRVQEGK